MVYFALLLAVVWGAIWAAFLQFVPLGRFLAQKRTWLTVVAGVGMDLVIALLIISWEMWLNFALVIAASSLPIIIRSLINEWNEMREAIRVYQDQAGQ